MKADIKHIRENNLMKKICEEKIKDYLFDGSIRVTEYGKNSVIHLAGDVCKKLEVIITGKVVIERIDESGNLMMIAEFFAGDVFGGNLIFSKSPYYPMTVTARNFTIIVEIDKERLFQLFMENQEFLKGYLEYVSDNTVILGDRINHYVNKTIRESIINYLDLEKKKQKSNKIKLTMSKTALAEKMGVQRTSLSRELAKMRAEGLICFDTKYIEILKERK